MTHEGVPLVIVPEFCNFTFTYALSLTAKRLLGPELATSTALTNFELRDTRT
jgi:hypothetical protein